MNAFGQFIKSLKIRIEIETHLLQRPLSENQLDLTPEGLHLNPEIFTRLAMIGKTEESGADSVAKGVDIAAASRLIEHRA